MLTRTRLVEAQIDHATYYLTLVQAWQSQQPLSESYVLLIEQEWQQVQQAQSWCARHSADLPSAAQLCVQFGLINHELLESRLDTESQIEWYQTALNTMTPSQQDTAHVSLLRYLALSYGRIGNYAVALDYLQKAVSLLNEQNEQTPLHAQLLNSMGAVLGQMGESLQAEPYYLESLRVSRPQSEEYANAHWGLGILYNALSRLEEAQYHLERSLTMYQSQHNTMKIAQVYGMMGEVAYTRGDYATARRYQMACIHLAEAIGFIRGLTMAFRNLAYIASDEGNAVEAEAAFKRSLTYCNQLGDLREYAIILGGLARLQWNQGDYTQAEANYRESLAACEQTGDQMGMAYMLLAISQISQHHNNIPQAVAELEQARTILERLNEPWGQAKVIMSLGDLAYNHRQFEQAANHYMTMLALVEQIGDPRGQAIACVNLGKAYLKLNNPEAGTCLQRGLHLAREVNLLPLVMEAWLAIAEWWWASSKTLDSLALLGFLVQQPHLSEPNAAHAQYLIAEISSTLPTSQAQQALDQAASHTIEHFERLL